MTSDNGATLRPVRDRLIVALDVETRQAAFGLVDQLAGRVGLFKIGSQLFSAEGPALVREIVARGERVFLDLKYHDIPNTVAAAAVAATRLGVSILNVHASGGAAMMAAAAEAVATTAEHEGLSRPAVLAVTVLTSLDTPALQQVGVNENAATHVLRLARLAKDSGLDGVVASPLEIRPIRTQVAADNFIILTPGIRPGGGEAGDQKRIATPAEAVRAGADYLVIGRPIIAAADPVAALEQIVVETT